MTVEYRDVPDFPGYRVGNDGSVWTCWKQVGRRGAGGGRGTDTVISTEWRRLSPGLNPSGHRSLQLSRGRKQYKRLVHRLVLETFVGSCPEGMECCHNNGDPADNRLENLRWDTHSENAKDIYRHGQPVIRGEAHANAKLTQEKIHDIRARYAAGEKQTELARAFGVHQSVISRIARGQRWRHVSVSA